MISAKLGDVFTHTANTVLMVVDVYCVCVCVCARETETEEGERDGG